MSIDENLFKQKDGHAFCSPSSAKTWLRCTMSPYKQYIHGTKSEDDTTHSSKGSLLHDEAEKYLSGSGEGKENLSEEIQKYCEVCDTLKSESILYGVEYKIPLFYSPEEHGTVDFWAVTGDGLYVVDLKTGHQNVEANKNEQLCIYAISLAERIEYEGNVKIIVCQLEDVKSWQTSIMELNWFRIDVEATIDSIKNRKNLKFVPSESNCMFCSAKGRCLAYQKDSEEFMNISDIKDVHAEPKWEDTLWLFENWKKVEKQVAKRIEAVVDRAKREPIAGLKWVAGRKPAKAWRDPQEAEKELIKEGISKDKLYKDPKFVTPTQALKLTKSPNVEKWIIEPERKPTLVPESDKREAISKETTFDNI